MINMGFWKTLKATTVRNLRVIFKYKFEIFINISWLILDIIAFSLLGHIVESTSVDLEYSLRDFLLVGVFFWAFFGKSYDDTVNCIPEEASRGTLGFLLTNNVSFVTLLTARATASSIISAVVAICIIFPILAVLDVLQLQLQWLLLAMVIFFLCWLFMLGVSLLVSSVNVLFKRIGLFSALFLWALKILSGYFFPVEALDDFVPGLSFMAMSLPTSAGLQLIRWVLILGAPPPEMMWNALTSLLIGTTIVMVAAIIILKQMEKIAAKVGTLEFY